MLNITGRHANRGGCAMPATWFVCPEWIAEGWAPQRSVPALVRQLFLGGHEIASHTLTHPRWPSAAEIVGARAWLNETAGVPLEAVRGFRAPYLSQDASQRAILRQAGFLYDRCGVGTHPLLHLAPGERQGVTDAQLCCYPAPPPPTSSHPPQLAHDAVGPRPGVPQRRRPGLALDDGLWSGALGARGAPAGPVGAAAVGGAG